LDRPRARSASRTQCRASRRKFQNRVYEILMTQATGFIREGDNRSARAHLRDAFRLRPFRALASGRWPWLLTMPRE
jgi:hypothetical protein